MQVELDLAVSNSNRARWRVWIGSLILMVNVLAKRNFLNLEKRNRNNDKWSCSLLFKYNGSLRWGCPSLAVSWSPQHKSSACLPHFYSPRTINTVYLSSYYEASAYVNVQLLTKLRDIIITQTRGFRLLGMLNMPERQIYSPTANPLVRLDIAIIRLGSVVFWPSSVYSSQRRC